MSQHSNYVFSYQGAVISGWGMVPVWLCHVLISPLPFHDISENKCVTSCTGLKQILVAADKNLGEICFEAQLGRTCSALIATNFQNMSFLSPLDVKNHCKWVIFQAACLSLEDILSNDSMCSVVYLQECSIYRCSISEDTSRTSVFGHFTFIVYAEQLLRSSVLEVQKMLCNLLPSS